MLNIKRINPGLVGPVSGLCDWLIYSCLVSHATTGSSYLHDMTEKVVESTIKHQ